MKKMLIASTLLLTACSNNPLQEHTKKQNIAFLRQAAIHAEHSMNAASRKGRLYRYCMEENPEQIDCVGFFNKMLEFAHTTKEYGNLTYDQLTDVTLYAALAEAYQNTLFNSLDE